MPYSDTFYLQFGSGNYFYVVVYERIGYAQNSVTGTDNEIISQPDPRDWNLITSNFDPEFLKTCNWWEMDGTTGILDFQKEGFDNKTFLSCLTKIPGSENLKLFTISENTGYQYRIKILLNPLFSRMHRPMYPEVYWDFVLDTRYVLSEGTPNTIARKFFYPPGKTTTLLISDSYMIENNNPNVSPHTPNWYPPETPTNWYDTSYGGGGGYVADADTSDMIRNPYYDNSRVHCWGWCFQGTGFYFNLKLIRQNMGLNKYRDTGEYVKITTITPTNYDMISANYFAHTEKFSQRFYYDINAYTPGPGSTKAKIFKPSLAFNLEGRGTGLTIGEIVLLHRVAQVVSIEKTGAKKIKVKVKNIVASVTYMVCFAGLSGRYTTLDGKVIKDKYGNELQTKYKIFTS